MWPDGGGFVRRGRAARRQHNARSTPARRRALTLRFARIAATRLRRLLDPEAGHWL